MNEYSYDLLDKFQQIDKSPPVSLTFLHHWYISQQLSENLKAYDYQLVYKWEDNLEVDRLLP